HLPVSIINQRAPWESFGPERVLNITTKWQTFRLPFRVGDNAIRNAACITFNGGSQTGTVWLGDVALMPLEEGNAPAMVDLFPQRGRNNGWNLECDSINGANGEMTDLADGTTRVKVKMTGWQE